MKIKTNNNLEIKVDNKIKIQGDEVYIEVKGTIPSDQVDLWKSVEQMLLSLTVDEAKDILKQIKERK